MGNIPYDVTEEKLKDIFSEAGPYGDAVDPTQAPENKSCVLSSTWTDVWAHAIDVHVQCMQNNPNEARQMLLQKPQLAYALLQALVVTSVVDPINALSMLQKGSRPYRLENGRTTLRQNTQLSNAK